MVAIESPTGSSAGRKLGGPSYSPFAMRTLVAIASRIRRGQPGTQCTFKRVLGRVRNSTPSPCVAEGNHFRLGLPWYHGQRRAARATPSCRIHVSHTCSKSQGLIAEHVHQYKRIINHSLTALVVKSITITSFSHYICLPVGKPRPVGEYI
jgi:hypothetical protein